MKQNLTVTDLHYHRNGICGVGFVAAKFTFKENGRIYPAIATIFEINDEGKSTGHCAVLVQENDNEIGIHDTWRGDHFEQDLRDFIKSDAGQKMMFPHLETAI